MNQCELGYGHISDGNTSNYMSFGLHSIAAMALTGQGRLGIGTTTPRSQLQTTGNAIINNATIGTMGWSAAFAGFAHSNCANQTQYAVLQDNSGGTTINSATGQATYFRINNNTDVAFIESERIGILGSNTLEFGTDQTKQPDDGKIRFRGWSDFLDIVGTRPAGETGARGVKIWDILQVGSTNYISDSNLKKNVQPLGRMLDKLENWEGKTFEWKKDETGKNIYKQGRQVGLLAQDIQAICPEAVSEMDGGLCYDQTALNGLLVQLCKDLKDEIDELKKKIKK
jgi:hypothetical protein